MRSTAPSCLFFSHGRVSSQFFHCIRRSSEHTLSAANMPSRLFLVHAYCIIRHRTDTASREKSNSHLLPSSDDSCLSLHTDRYRKTPAPGRSQIDLFTASFHHCKIHSFLLRKIDDYIRSRMPEDQIRRCHSSMVNEYHIVTPLLVGSAPCPKSSSLLPQYRLASSRSLLWLDSDP